jgi:hypothetical protein
MMRRMVFSAAIAAVAAAGVSTEITAARQAGGAAQSAPTPRTPDGTPDLSGMWVGFGGGEGGRDYTPDAQGNVTSLSPFRPCHPGQECRAAVNSERDSGMRQRILGPNYNVPLYKPEYWDRVQDLDVNGNRRDLSARCYPLGVPRMGAPDKIMQSANEVAFFYRRGNRFRVIPTDGRPHDPVRANDVQWDGEPSGRWEGDTLVVESIGFTDERWIGWPGYFHSYEMRVVERLRREGNTLTWQATVHDPEVLMKPYEMAPVRRRIHPDPLARLTEDPPCDEADLDHMKTRERG